MLSLLFTILLICSCDRQTSDDHQEVFQQLMKEHLNGASFNLGVSMTVFAPKVGINWTGVCGFNDLKKKEPLEINRPFRIASVTKTFVAATILRMEEETMLHLSDPITQYIDSSYINLLVNDGYEPHKISISHCLTHTSGLFNYAQGGRSYLDKVVDDPHHKWDRRQQLEHAMEFGSAVGQPGEVFHYSDTGYILLGHIIEQITGQHYGVAMRKLLAFDQLQLDHTWLEYYEQPGDNIPEELFRYNRGEDFSHFDASVDLFGGGGLISSTSDLAVFLQALFNDEVFDRPETLQHMLSEVSYGEDYDPATDKKFLDYRKGLYRISLYGMDGYMHSGFWGTVILHIPDLKATIAIDTLNGSTDRLIKKVVWYLKNLKSAN